jgi:hypothetical protein
MILFLVLYTKSIISNMRAILGFPYLFTSRILYYIYYNLLILLVSSL